MPHDRKRMPHDKPLETAWLSETDGLDTFRSTPELPKAVDVVVIGAGMAGCAAALRCCRLGHSCLLLDSGGVAGGATGRNGGHLWPAGGGYDTPRGRYEASAVERLRQLLRELSDDGGEEAFDVRFPGSVELAVTLEQAEVIKSGVGEFWDAGRVRAEYQSADGKLFGGMFHSGGGMLHPVRATRALACAALADGLNLQTHCRVTQVGGCDEQGSVEVATERGMVQAMIAVIVCANAWLSTVLPELEGVVVPHVNHVLVTEPLPFRWAHPFTADDDRWYGMQRPDGRIVIGGAPLPAPSAGALCGQAPRLSDRCVLALRKWVADYFPAISADKGIRLEAEWAGYLTETADHLPLVGRAREKVWVCGAFNGHGMPVAAAMGADCADLALAGHEVSSHEYLGQLAPRRLLASKTQPSRVHSNLSGSPTGEERANTCVWDHFVWDTLPPHLKSKWEELGWTRTSFDGHTDPPTSEALPWQQLELPQRAAAEALGYSEALWDSGGEPWRLPNGVSERDEQPAGTSEVVVPPAGNDEATESEARVQVQDERPVPDFRSLCDKDVHFPPRRPVLGAGCVAGGDYDGALALMRQGQSEPGQVELEARSCSLWGVGLPSIFGGSSGSGMMKKSTRSEEEQISLEQELNALFDQVCADQCNGRGLLREPDTHDSVSAGTFSGDAAGGKGHEAPGGLRGKALLAAALRPALDCPLPPCEPALGGVLQDKVTTTKVVGGGGGE